MLKISYYLCLILLVLGQLVAVKHFDGSGLYLFDLAIGVFDFIGVIYFLLVRKKFKLPKSLMFFFIFGIVGFVSLLFSLFKYPIFDIFPGAMYLFRFLGYLISGVVIFNMLKENLLSPKEFYESIIFSGLFIAIAGFVQLYLLPDFTVMDSSLGWDPHKNRLASTFFDPNFAGAYLAVCLAVILDKYYKSRKLTPKEYLIFVVILVAIFLTFSRSAWAMLAVIIFVFGFFKSRTLLYVSLLVAFCAYFAVPRVQTRIAGATDPADSARYRLESWSNAIKISRDNLLVGVGFNNYKIVQKEYGFLEIDALNDHSSSGSDSSLLLVLATTGIFGLLIYLMGFLSPIFKNHKTDTLMLTLSLGLLANSLFINSLFYPQIMFLLFSIHSFSHISR